jgi:MYXO-CTERM domain-containing protein
MHFADYNLFYNPDSPSQVDYSIAVEPDDVTPLAKGSDGFAKHDVHAAPKFTGPLPSAFPFASADVQAGSVKVSTILAHYRVLYTPAAGSPLVGAGDPASGAHNNIGAIGQGSNLDPSDQFGTFTPGVGGGPPPLHLPDGGVTPTAPDGGSGGKTSGVAGAGSTAPGGGSGAPGAGGTSGADAGPSPSRKGSKSGGCGCQLGEAPHPIRAGVALLFATVAVAARGRRRRRV